MKIITRKLFFETKGNSDILDITGYVRDELIKSSLNEGNILIFVPGSTVSVTTIEYEPGLRKDLPEVLNKLIPYDKKYHHNKTWGDNNAHAHIRSSIIGTSLNVPFVNGELVLGTWLQIVLVDFDEKPRRRKIVIQITGE